MKNKIIRFIPPTNKALESELKKQDLSLMRQWLSETIEELEYRIRYSSLEETKHIQGALRLSYDIVDVLDN